jgi:hypothetical protein
VPKFRETNELLEREGIKSKARKMTSKPFLKALLSRVRVRNFLTPDQQCTIRQENFEVMIRDVIEEIVKLKTPRMLDYIDPLVAKLKTKNVDKMDTVSHTYREAIKLMHTRGLISGPGEYIVVFS